MASMEVGDSWSSQVALRWAMGRRFCNAWAAWQVLQYAGMLALVG